MIIVTDHTYQEDPANDFHEYQITGTIDDYPFKFYIPKLDAEIDSVWDEQKTFDWLEVQHSELLSSVKAQTVQIINKKLEVLNSVQAEDFIVGSPDISLTLEGARQQIKKEVLKEKKSIAVLTLAQAELIEDLIKRVEALEA